MACFLPPNVLARILNFTAPSPQLLSHQWLERHQSAALRMLLHDHLLVASGVCHLWREVALTTPQLWTTIKLDLQFGGRITSANGGYHNAVTAILPWVLKQSAGLPLTLHLRIDSPSVVWSLLQPLLATSPRWKVADIRLSGDAKSSSWLLGVANQVPMLQTLRVNSRDAMLLGHTPSMTTLYTTLPLPNFSSTTFETLYVHAEGRPAQVVHALHALAVHKHTVHLAIDMLSNDALFPIRIPITTSYLTALHLTLWDWTSSRFYAQDMLDAVLPQLYLPSLRVMSLLYYGRHHPVISPSAFVRFIECSEISAVLRVLVLFNVAIGTAPSPNATASWLAALPALDRLSLSDMSPSTRSPRMGLAHPHGLVIDSALLSLLSIRRRSETKRAPHTPLFLPRLRHLVLNTHLEGFTGDDLLALVRARRTRVHACGAAPFQLEVNHFNTCAGGEIESRMRDALKVLSTQAGQGCVVGITRLAPEHEWTQVQSPWGEFWRVS
uniref:F-box domain-containing protein n=1 Tax=Mycena chlorophos TaxID=658473 RepID=A0ABQ0LZH2_MYCCL|nr:predicted protein [Mycena chlorophos]